MGKKVGDDLLQMEFLSFCNVARALGAIQNSGGSELKSLQVCSGMSLIY
jgi:hypothetical protein